jgi:hypothetical protein
MAVIKSSQPFDHSPTFVWTLTSGDSAAILPLPIGGKVILQVDGDLAGGVVDISGGLLENHLCVLKSFVSEGIVAAPPVRYVLPEFSGAPDGATVTVIVSIAP